MSDIVLQKSPNPVIRLVGRVILSPPYNGFRAIGEITWLFMMSLQQFKYAWVNRDLVLKQMIAIGVSTLPLVAITSIFTGMVAAVQSEYNFRDLIPDRYVGTATCKMVVIELGPILTALVMAGRVGSALAAEIGSMKEKEELSAMSVLNLNPFRYLAMPRLISYMVMMPALTIISIFIALVGGWIVSVIGLDINTYTYVTGLKFYFISSDLYASVFKAFVFGILICLLGYYHGLHAGSGAKGVGGATMKTVVSSSVALLVFDLIIAIAIFR
jgi:phospholipid/cholesterol/gamma-HCH transport system permease protein